MTSRQLGRIADDLYDLTEHAAKLNFEISGGILGGEFGYGAHLQSEVFGMHPFCWCERSDCPWCVPCECPDDSLIYTIDGQEVPANTFYSTGAFGGSGKRDCVEVPEKLCGNCRRPFVAPNFWHYPTKSWVSWYKYLGRDMEAQVNGDWGDIYAECLAALPACTGEPVAPPFGPTVHDLRYGAAPAT